MGNGQVLTRRPDRITVRPEAARSGVGTPTATSSLEEWDRAGLASGHAWAPCDRCGAVALQPRSGGRRCIMTPGCAGTHRVPAGRPTPLAALRLGLVTVAEVRANPPELGPTLRRLLATA